MQPESMRSCAQMVYELRLLSPKTQNRLDSGDAGRANDTARFDGGESVEPRPWLRNRGGHEPARLPSPFQAESARITAEVGGVVSTSNSSCSTRPEKSHAARHVPSRPHVDLHRRRRHIQAPVIDGLPLRRSSSSSCAQDDDLVLEKRLLRQTHRCRPHRVALLIGRQPQPMLGPPAAESGVRPTNDHGVSPTRLRSHMKCCARLSKRAQDLHLHSAREWARDLHLHSARDWHDLLRAAVKVRLIRLTCAVETGTASSILGLVGDHDRGGVCTPCSSWEGPQRILQRSVPDADGI